MTSAVNMTCCYLIMAGGTGGHIFPAMAVAKSLIERNANVHWLGTAAGMEYQLVPPAKIPLHFITIKGFRGKNLLQKCFAPFYLLSSIVQALKVIKRLNPQVVVGFGGYVSAPGGIAARLLGKQLIIHEQNSVAGSTNKLLAKIANYRLEAFPNSLGKALLVGNPIRSEVESLFNTEKFIDTDKTVNLLITGGSLGAAAINGVIPEVIKQLPEKLRPNIWHQTGKNKLTEVEAAYRSLAVVAEVQEFISDMESAYQWADLIICRAGALTVSEIAVVGVPAIFIPYPHAIDNHQMTNARWLVDNNAALMIEQSKLSVEYLEGELSKLLADKQALKSMSLNLKKLAKPDATQQVVDICEQACQGDNRYAA